MSRRAAIVVALVMLGSLLLLMIGVAVSLNDGPGGRDATSKIPR